MTRVWDLMLSVFGVYIYIYDLISFLAQCATILGGQTNSAARRKLCILLTVPKP